MRKQCISVYLIKAVHIIMSLALLSQYSNVVQYMYHFHTSNQREKPYSILHIALVLEYVLLSHLGSKESQWVYITYSTGSGVLYKRYTHTVLMSWYQCIHFIKAVHISR